MRHLTRPVIILSFCVFNAFSNLTLSDDRPSAHLFEAIDYDLFINMIEQSTVSHSSYSSYDMIPKSKIFQTVFLKIIFNIDHYQHMSAEDRKLILNIKTHHSILNEARDNGLYQTVCNELKSQESLDSIDVSELSKSYESSKRRANVVIKSYYNNILEELSIETQQTISDMIESYRGTKQISYSTVDIELLSFHSEEIALDILKFGCAQETLVRSRDDVELLKDVQMGWTPIKQQQVN